MRTLRVIVAPIAERYNLDGVVEIFVDEVNEGQFLGDVDAVANVAVENDLLTMQ